MKETKKRPKNYEKECLALCEEFCQQLKNLGAINQVLTLTVIGELNQKPTVFFYGPLSLQERKDFRDLVHLFLGTHGYLAKDDNDNTTNNGSNGTAFS